MLTLFTGSVSTDGGEIRVWAEGAEKARSPVSDGEFSVAFAGNPVAHVCIEHILDGQIRRAQIVPGNRDVLEVPPFTRGSTLRAVAWRQAVQRGLTDPTLFVEALLPDRVSTALGSISRDRRLREQAKLLRCLRIALHAKAFRWKWKALGPALNKELSPPIKMLIVIGVWRSALRVCALDRRLLEVCESAASTLQLRACQLAAAALEGPMSAHGLPLPDPRAGAWEIKVFMALRKHREDAFLPPAEICQEVATAMDRTLDGVVGEALRRDDPTVVTDTLRRQLESLEASLQRDLAGLVDIDTGGWIGVAALWVSTLSSLGFNADIDRATDIFSIS